MIQLYMHYTVTSLTVHIFCKVKKIASLGRQEPQPEVQLNVQQH